MGMKNLIGLGKALSASVTYEAGGHYTLLFGGSAFVPGVLDGDTWVWRSGWYPTITGRLSACAFGRGLAYDPTTGVVVLFGGSDSGNNRSVFGDTWTWERRDVEPPGDRFMDEPAQIKLAHLLWVGPLTIGLSVVAVVFIRVVAVALLKPDSSPAMRFIR